MCPLADSGPRVSPSPKAPSFSSPQAVPKGVVNAGTKEKRPPSPCLGRPRTKGVGRWSPDPTKGPKDRGEPSLPPRPVASPDAAPSLSPARGLLAGSNGFRPRAGLREGVPRKASRFAPWTHRIHQGSAAALHSGVTPLPPSLSTDHRGLGSAEGGIQLGFREGLFGLWRGVCLQPAICTQIRSARLQC